jgi:hypothetical protein
MIAQQKEDEEGEGGSRQGSPRMLRAAAEAAPYGKRANNLAAAAEAEAAIASAETMGRAASQLLVRHGHTAVVSGSVAVVFGGVRNGRTSNELLSVRFRDLAVSPLPATGAPPPARHSHAAAVERAGMLVSGGIDNTRIFGDVYHLAIPSLVWSRLRLPSVPPSPSRSAPPPSNLASPPGVLIHASGFSAAPVQARPRDRVDG